MISRRALFTLELVDGAAPPEPAVPVAPPKPSATPPASARPLVAVVSTFSCLNAKADFCATCVERCPVPGALKVEGRRVFVIASACTGCGVCVPLCPAPGGAILLTPVFT